MKELNKYVLFLLTLAIIVLPFDINLNTYVLFVATAFWIVLVFKNPLVLKKVNVADLIILSIPFWLAVLGLLYSTNIEYGVGFVLRMVSFLLLPLIFATLNINQKQRNTIVLFFLGSTMLRFIIAVFLFFGSGQGQLNDINAQNAFLKFNSFFSYEIIHPTYFSIFVVIGIFAATQAFFIYRRRQTRMLLGIFIFISTLTIIVLTVKMVLAALVLCAVVIPLFYLSKTFNKRLLRIYFIVVFSFLGIGSIILLKIPNRATQEAYNYYNYIMGNELKNLYPYNELSMEYETFWWEKTNRTVIWKNVLDLIGKKPIFGYGTGDVQDELIKAYSENGELWRMQFFNSHNQYLDYQLRYGLIGAGLFLYMLFFCFKQSINNLDYFYLAFLVLFAVCLLTENLLQRHWGIVFFAFFNSMSFSLNKTKKFIE